MKTISINKVIKEIRQKKDYNEYGLHYKYGLDTAIQIIKDNIVEGEKMHGYDTIMNEAWEYINNCVKDSKELKRFEAEIKSKKGMGELIQEEDKKKKKKKKNRIPSGLDDIIIMY